jgi:hypothetical protein
VAKHERVPSLERRPRDPSLRCDTSLASPALAAARGAPRANTKATYQARTPDRPGGSQETAGPTAPETPARSHASPPDRRSRRPAQGLCRCPSPRWLGGRRAARSRDNAADPVHSRRERGSPGATDRLRAIQNAPPARPQRTLGRNQNIYADERNACPVALGRFSSLDESRQLRTTKSG